MSTCLMNRKWFVIFVQHKNNYRKCSHHIEPSVYSIWYLNYDIVSSLIYQSNSLFASFLSGVNQLNSSW